MLTRWSSKKVKTLFSLIGTACLLLFFPGLTLSACFNTNCSGIAISCTYTIPSPTPNSPALVATANAITEGKPLLVDSLSQEDSNKWGNHAGKCFFQDAAYTVEYSQTPGSTFGCDSDQLHYGDIAIQMDVTLISGDNAGILFRVDPYFSQMYFFDITSQREAEFLLFGPDSGATTNLMPATFNSAIRGVGQKNTLLLIARGNNFQLFVNGTFVGETHDGTIASGSVGMGVSDYLKSAKAHFSNLVIYQL